MPIKNYEHGCSTTQALATLGKVEGVIPLLHGPQTCVFQNQISTLYCRPANLITAGTLVSKSEVIFGGDESLKQQIRNVYEKYKPRVIVIINTCIPQLNGDDVEGVIIEMERELPGLRLSTLIELANAKQVKLHAEYWLQLYRRDAARFRCLLGRDSGDLAEVRDRRGFGRADRTLWSGCR